MDCDGVLMTVLGLRETHEQKSFHVRDGLGLYLWHHSGLNTGIISGALARIGAARPGSRDRVCTAGSETSEDFEELLRLADVDEKAVAFVGDDLNDIPLMLRSEFAVAVADAAEETRAVAHLVTQAAGGSGAIREVVEFILKAQDRWTEVTEKYLRPVRQLSHVVGGFVPVFSIRGRRERGVGVGRCRLRAK